MIERAFDFDVAVIGAGPAGSACALSAARGGMRVALFEPQRGPIDKPCGEGVMPAGLDALANLGLEHVIEAGREFEALCFFLADCAPVEVPLPRPGVSIERPVLHAAFDAALANEPRVTRIAEHARAERDDVGFRVRTRSGDVRARALVSTAGLGSRGVTDMRVARRGDASRVGVRARFEASVPLGRVEIHFGAHEEIYLTPLARNRVNAVVLTRDRACDGNAAELLSAVVARHPAAARYLGECVTAPEARMLDAIRPRKLAERGAFLAGDAGGGVDPILGCGVTIALGTGVLAARHATRVALGDASGTQERDYARAYARHTRARRALAALLLALARNSTLARGTATVARLSPWLRDALVGVAAGAA